MTQEVKTSKMQPAPEQKSEDGFWVASTDLRKEFDRLFDTLMQPSSWFPNKSEGGGFSPPWTWGSGAGKFTPAVDFVEKDGEYVVKAEIPGVEADDISVDVTGEILTIKGEKTQSAEHKDKNYHLQECHHGLFQRSFPLPRDIDGDKIAASFDKGVLTVTLPKIKGAVGSTKKVAISTP